MSDRTVAHGALFCGFSIERYVPTADSGLKPAGIPINYRPPFRFEAGHYSNQLPAGSRR